MVTCDTHPACDPDPDPDPACDPDPDPVSDCRDDSFPDLHVDHDLDCAGDTARAYDLDCDQEDMDCGCGCGCDGGPVCGPSGWGWNSDVVVVCMGLSCLSSLPRVSR